ncbi:MAG: LysM peptidoglycan-binding domain-containing protein [Clostridia bacterium]|nr:LysM peptidoglycan-binding domain-containing protein [Clostridia bacterium]
MQEKRLIKDVCNIREKQVIPEVRNEKIYDVDIRPRIIKQNILNDRIIFEGELNVNFLYSNSNTSVIETKNIVIPFNHNMNCEGINQNSKLDVKMEIGTKDVIIMPDESIELKIDVNLLIDIFKSVEINIINDMKIEENKDNEIYSIIIYFVKPGDTLWKIAKKFRSTVENIVKINDIEDENKIYPGQQLFIPKYVANTNSVSA